MKPERKLNMNPTDGNELKENKKIPELKIGDEYMDPVAGIPRKITFLGDESYRFHIKNIKKSPYGYYEAIKGSEQFDTLTKDKRFEGEFVKKEPSVELEYIVDDLEVRRMVVSRDLLLEKFKPISKTKDTSMTVNESKEKKDSHVVDIKQLIENKFKSISKESPQNLDKDYIDNLKQNLPKFFGEENLDISYAQTNNEQEEFKVLCTMPYNENLSLINVLSKDFDVSASQKIDQSIRVDDMFYVDNKSGKSVSIKDLTGSHFDIYFDNSLNDHAYQTMAKTTSNEENDYKLAVFMPVPGTNNPPQGIFSRGLWNAFNKVEPVVMLHEIRHTQQKKLQLEQTTLQEERDAWAYALKEIRKLKKDGLDLLSNVKTDHIFSKVEMGLISYDIKSTFSEGRYGEQEEAFFSKQTKGINKYMNKGHTTKVISSVLAAIKQVIKDPSSATDTLLYKGKRNLEPVSLDTLINHSN